MRRETEAASEGDLILCGTELMEVMLSRRLVADGHHFFYFAYGSNLLEERMHVQVKGAVFKTIGVLRHYKVAFFDFGMRWMGAVASIERAEDDEVWGCVWRVPLKYSDELDLQEKGYNRMNVDVNVDGTIVTCRTYQYANPCRKIANPSPQYMKVIVSGAIEHNFPQNYVSKLKAVKDNGYSGPVQLDLAVLRDFNVNGISDDIPN